MNNSNQPLTEQEFDRLAGFLDAIGSPAMNLETVDGYFAALICGPEVVPPSEYLPEIWGEDYAFESNEQASDIVGLLMRHWNTISSALQRTLEVPDVYLPVLLEAKDGIAHGNDWAQGFLRGVATRPASWRELLDSEEHGGSLLPIMLLAHEHDPDPQMRPKPVQPEKREELLQMMTAGLTRIYRYLQPHRESTAHALSDDAQMPLRRAGPKVSRNDPCPCGSGRKYKQCCAATAPTLH